MSYKSKNIISPNKSLAQANAFDSVAELCEIESAEFKCSLQSRFADGIANSAFACELFLKALLIHSEKNIAEIRKFNHNLYELFRELEDTDKTTALIIERHVMELLEPSKKKKPLFTFILKESSRAFNYWRYIYKQSINEASLQLARIFRIFLKQICNKKLNTTAKK